MRITFIIPCPNLSGGIRVVATYAERLSKRGHKVTIVSTPRPRASFRQTVRSLLRGRGWLSGIRPIPTHIDEADVEHRAIDCFRPIVDEDVPDADVVIATWWETALWVADLSASKGTKIYFVQGYETKAGLDRLETIYRLPMFKVTVSHWLHRLLSDRYKEPAFLVPNSVDGSQFYSDKKKRQAKFTVGFIYSTSKIKGCDIVLDALKKVQDKLGTIELKSFGCVREPQVLSQFFRCKYYHLPPQVQLRKIYSQCDVWLFGSRQEGFGLPILEAMACRTPVIGTSAGAAPELLAQGGGILVTRDDSEDMARAILTVASMPDEEWQKMSEAAYRTATSYTWDDATDLFEAALCSAIERTEPGELSPTK